MVQLKVFFTVVGKDVDAVRPVDVLGFITAQRAGLSSLPGPHLVPAPHPRKEGLSLRTIRRRLSTITGLYAFLTVRGDVAVDPVPRGLPTRREKSRPAQGVPLVRASLRLPRILSPAAVDALTTALRTHRDRAMVAAMLLGGLRRCEVLGGAAMATWEQVTADLPQVAATMRAYLGQLAVVLRPGSVNNTDQCLRYLATYLLIHHPEVTSVRDIGRAHIEGFKPWLASRPGRDGAPLSAATIAHRLGTLRMFFLRIDEWGWEQDPARVPMFPGDVPKQHHTLPKALDNQSAARILSAAQADRRQLVGLTVEFLLRTGLRVGEYTALSADAVVLIGDTHWLHVLVGKLHEDRYLPLHPRLVELVSVYRTVHVPDGHRLLLPMQACGYDHACW